MVIDLAPTNHSIFNCHECLVNVVAPLVSHPQAPRPLLPTERALHNPPMSPQFLAALHAPTCQARLNPTCPQATPQMSVVICLVRMNLCRTMTWTTPLAPHRNAVHTGTAPVQGVRGFQWCQQGLVQCLPHARRHAAPAHMFAARFAARPQSLWAPWQVQKRLDNCLYLRCREQAAHPGHGSGELPPPVAHSNNEPYLVSTGFEAPAFAGGAVRIGRIRKMRGPDAKGTSLRNKLNFADIVRLTPQ